MAIPEFKDKRAIEQIIEDNNVRINTYDKKYIDLIKDILENGSKCNNDRTGTGTVKVFGRQLRHNMKEGFPMLTTRKMFYKNAIYELLWFLKGDTNIKYLVDNNVNVWVGDCYKYYTTLCSDNTSKYNNWMRDNNDGTFSMYTRDEFINQIKIDNDFAKEWGELNAVYGKEWIDWYGINQIQELVDTLKNNPDSRRMMVTAWNPINVKKAKLPPCHYAFQCFTSELTLEERINIAKNNLEFNKAFSKNTFSMDYNNDITLCKQIENYLNVLNIPKRKISLMYNMRSVDIPLGFPQDNILYSMLLQMLAQCVNMVPDEIIASLADTHIYLNQIEMLKEQLNKTPYELPLLKLNPLIKNIFNFKFEDFEIINYNCHDKIVIPLSN